MTVIERWLCPEHGEVRGQREAIMGRVPGCEVCERELVGHVPASQLRGAVDLLREIGVMAGARANGADAKAMARRAREWLEAHDHFGGSRP